MSKSQPIADATQEERTNIREAYNRVVVSRSPNSHPTKLHIPHLDSCDEPVCRSKRQHNGNSPAGPREVTYVTKDMAVYPPGWADICSYCVQWWRENGQ